jgi:hypothetical protein
MVPVFALEALNHELFDVVAVVGLVAVTIAIEEVFVVVVLLVFVVLFLVVE